VALDQNALACDEKGQNTGPFLLPFPGTTSKLAKPPYPRPLRLDHGFTLALDFYFNVTESPKHKTSFGESRRAKAARKPSRTNPIYGK
jgi:hypothetical protein